MIKPKKMKSEDKDILERIIHNLKTELDKLKESNQTLYQSCSQKNYDIKELQSQLEKEREENKKLISLLRESALAIYLHVPKKKQSDMQKYFDKHGYKIDDCENCLNSGCSECDFTGFQINPNQRR